MVFTAGGLVPTRFLTLIAHLTITIIILWSREENIKACLANEYTNEEYTRKDTQIVVGLSLALGFISIELLGFLSGISMFMPTTAMISILAHASASVLLWHFLSEEWDCDLYWWVFGLCSALPGTFELITVTAFLCLRKT